MVNGVTAPEELGEQPKDADPAREPHGQKGEPGWHRGSTESVLPPVIPRPRDTHRFSADAPAVEVKSLDLLAALPTPPHNQTEDVR